MLVHIHVHNIYHLQFTNLFSCRISLSLPPRLLHMLSRCAMNTPAPCTLDLLIISLLHLLFRFAHNIPAPPTLQICPESLCLLRLLQAVLILTLGLPRISLPCRLVRICCSMASTQPSRSCHTESQNKHSERYR